MQDMKIEITLDDGVVYGGSVLDLAFTEQSDRLALRFSGTLYNPVVKIAPNSRMVQAPKPVSISASQFARAVTRAITFED